MRFLQGLTKAQRVVFVTLCAAIPVNAMLWLFFGRHTAVEYWNFRRCNWEVPAAPEA